MENRLSRTAHSVPIGRSPLGPRAQSAGQAPINTSGLRGELPHGTLTYRDLFKLCPFDNKLVTVKIRGRELRKVVEGSLRESGASMQYSGLSIVYDPASPPGSRLVSLEVGRNRLDDDRVYAFFTVDFVATVGSAFRALEREVGPPQEQILRDILEAESRARSPIAAAPDDRLTLRVAR